MKEVLAEYDTPGIDLGRDVLFDTYIENWLESVRHSIEPTTYDIYKFNLDRHIIPYFKPQKLRVKDLTPAHIQQFINHCLSSVTANTVRKYLANISKCLDSAVKQNLIAFNPVKRVDLPKKEKYTGAKFYNERQISELLERSKGDVLEMVILLTVFYGLRRSEVLGLKWDAIDMVNNTISIRHTVVPGHKAIYEKDSTKNESSCAALPLPDMIRLRLLMWQRQQRANKLLQPNDYTDNGYVCTMVNGKLIRPDFVSQHFQILLRNIGMPTIRFHDLRHSSAHYLKYLGFDLKDIQTWLRHKDIQTTMNIYLGNLDMEAKRGIAGRLNERFRNFGC